MKELRVNTASKSYDIVFSQSFDQLPEVIGKLNKNFSKIAIITDDQVGRIYLDEMSTQLKNCFPEVYSYTFLHGESSKNLDTLSDFYKFMIECKLDRKSLLIALGGGVTGDMVGFAAATYMRGIPFIQVPTSLLAQVDSSIGGKTAVDFNGYKNIVGAFNQPELVYINTSTLKTLSTKEFNSGMGEVIKHGLIADKNYLQEINNMSASIKSLDPDALTNMIYKSCEIKNLVVSEDEREEGRRALLNFGHTAGHAIERLINFELFHGECVSIGMMVALYLSESLGYISSDEVQKAKEIIELYELPTTVSNIEPLAVYNDMFLDKKTSNNCLNYVLLEQVGHAFINKTIDKEMLLMALGKVIK